MREFGLTILGRAAYDVTFSEMTMIPSDAVHELVRRIIEGAAR